MIYAAAIIAAALCALAYSLGRFTGEKRGRALGWLERNDQEINRDAKRDTYREEERRAEQHLESADVSASKTADALRAESTAPANHPDTVRLDAIEQMIRDGRYNVATGRTEVTALNCHMVCSRGIREVVDLAIAEGRVPSDVSNHGGAK